MYLWTLPYIDGMSISYDITAQIFIDQIVGPDGDMVYTFVVGQDSLHMILGGEVTKQDDGRSVADILDIAQSLDRHGNQQQT
jgi:hypothetical protein